MLFLIFSVILFNLIAILIPKRMSQIEILTTTLFSLYFETITNVFLDLKYDWYGYFTKGVNWETILYLFGIFPAVSIVFLNSFPYHKKLKSKIYYLFWWVVFAGIYETLFVWSKTFYYNGWNLWYSIILYPFIYLTLVIFHQYTRYLLKKTC
ncbi:CBO0543 family protein [Neobacillus sp. SM06]|uniref:CBO0543 family protein n=1 Tax=Neobacillus sp. SM06 TaxID=3422492 RepID=UPI003D2E10FF